MENKDKEKEYKKHITGKLRQIERKQDVNEEWINVKNFILESAKEKIREQRKERNLRLVRQRMSDCNEIKE